MPQAAYDSPLVDPDTMTTSQLMERMFELRAQSKDIKDQAKVLDREYDDLGRILLNKMREQGVTRAAIPQGTAIHSKVTVPQVHDWDAVERWAIENDALHIFNRALTASAYREYLASGQEIPGTSPYEKESIQLRSAA